MDFQKRKRGKDKSKNTFNKYGKYTNKAMRLKEAQNKPSNTVNKKAEVKKN